MPAKQRGMLAPGSKVTVHGDSIRINASVKPSGYIKTQVRTFGGGVIEGRTFGTADRIIGDGPHLPVSWNGDDTLNHNGAPLIFSFKLRRAKLFGIEFF